MDFKEENYFLSKIIYLWKSMFHKNINEVMKL